MPDAHVWLVTLHAQILSPYSKPIRAVHTYVRTHTLLASLGALETLETQPSPTYRGPRLRLSLSQAPRCALTPATHVTHLVTQGHTLFPASRR